MMSWLFLFFLQPGSLDRLAASNRVTLLADSDSVRLQGEARTVAPGKPPLLSFRYFEGNRRRRFSDSDLVVDDAGH